jgi:hypothetical protein
MTDEASDMLEQMAAFADDAPSEHDLFADPRWDEVAAGTASESTVAELRRLSEEAGLPEAFDMFAPMSPDETERVQRAVAAVVESERDDLKDTAAAAPRSLAAVRASRRRPVVFGVVAALAMAAAVALFWRSPSPEPVASAWPAYDATLSGGEREFRDDAEARRFRAGSTLTIQLRPERAVDGAPAVRAWVVGPERAVALVGELQTAPTGALRFRATLPVKLPAAPVSVWLVLGVDAELPPPTADRAALLSTSLQRVEVALALVEDGSP